MIQMEIDRYFSAVVANTRDKIKLGTCRRHKGSLGFDDIKSHTITLPAILFALRALEVQGYAAADRVDTILYMAALVVTKDQVRDSRAERPRDVAGWQMAVTLMRLIRLNDFGLECAGPAMVERIDNLANESTLSTGVHVLALTWKQPLSLDAREASDMDDTYGPLEACYVVPPTGIPEPLA